MFGRRGSAAQADAVFTEKKSAPTTLGSIAGALSGPYEEESNRLPLLRYADRIDVSVRVPLGTETVEALFCGWPASASWRYASELHDFKVRSSIVGNRQGCCMDKIRQAKEAARKLKADQQRARREKRQRNKATAPPSTSS